MFRACAVGFDVTDKLENPSFVRPRQGMTLSMREIRFEFGAKQCLVVIFICKTDTVAFFFYLTNIVSL